MTEKRDQILSDLRDMGIGMTDTVPVATYNRMVRKRDEAVAENLKLREMYRVVVKQLSDAPHAPGCGVRVDEVAERVFYDSPCCCWKAGL